MKIRELIELLKRADPEGEVFGEFEGDIFPIELNDVRVGRATLHRLRTLPDGTHYDSWVSPNYPQGHFPIVRQAEGVLLWAGESSKEWPNRLVDAHSQHCADCGWSGTDSDFHACPGRPGENKW